MNAEKIKYLRQLVIRDIKNITERHTSYTDIVNGLTNSSDKEFWIKRINGCEQRLLVAAKSLELLNTIPK